MSKKLLSGYTTGTHATAVLIATLYEKYQNKILKKVDIYLPKNILATISVKREGKLLFSTIKTDNDDLDVTKGCKIVLKLSEQKPKNLKAQIPTLLNINKTKLYIYAGDGIGIVTKKGLKIEPNFPAINPTPLNMMLLNAKKIVKDINKTLHAVFYVENGEELAKQTANEKVGVIGGISILGTRGIVKPISADAYLNSIKTEIDVAEALNSKIIVFTLGNTAHDYATNIFDDSIVIEVGNFIYDGINKLKHTNFEKFIFIASVAKMCKVAQGYKNTHNRFGNIDFNKVQLHLKKELKVDIHTKEHLTLKSILKILDDTQIEIFLKSLNIKTKIIFKHWFKELSIDIKNIDIITINSIEKKG